MTNRRASLLLMLSGTILILSGSLLWRASALDLALHHTLLLTRLGWWARQTLRFTAFGGFLAMGPIALAAAALLVWRKRARQALWLVLTITTGRLVVEGVKLLVQRPRPPAIDRLELVSSWSFPSSHSAGTMMTCAALALLWGRPVGWLVALLVAAAIGWSRVALGVHWPSDVLAGWGFGLLWVGAASRWMPPRAP
jgi:undecaprenyl-diphosphatase